MGLFALYTNDFHTLAILSDNSGRFGSGSV